MSFPNMDLESALPILLLYIALFLTTNMGAGDFKYGILLGAIHPPHHLLMYMVGLSVALAATYSLKRAPRMIPMAPAISAATLFNM